jgi:hypothetical protein
MFTSVFGNEPINFFEVTIHDRSVSVRGPEKKLSPVSIVLKNDTLENLNAKIATQDKNLIFVALKPRASRTIEVKYENIDQLFFIPLSPPFQSVELKFGLKPYEIPEK